MRHIARSFAAADATGGGDPVISIDGVDATNVSTPSIGIPSYSCIRAGSLTSVLLWKIPQLARV